MKFIAERQSDGIPCSIMFCVDADEATWSQVLAEFFCFMNAAGWVIDPDAIPEMVQACVQAHDDYLGVEDLRRKFKEELDNG